MNIQIRLAKLNGNQAVAELENDGDSFVIAVTRGQVTGKSACRAAAENLRKLADRFDLLGAEPDAFKETTQNEVNRRK